MSPFEKVALLATFMSAANCFLLSVIERNVRKRLDEQAMRLAEIENAIGLAPLFPLDVECPICDDLLDDMTDLATGFADAMLQEYEERFEGGKARRRGKRREESEDPEDDPDND